MTTPVTVTEYNAAMKTSNTALEQYIRCPYQFHQERHKKNRGKPNQGMLMGRVVHRTVDSILKTHKENGKIDFLDIHEATAVFTDEWAAENGLHDQELFTRGLQQISDLIDALGEIDPARILATEQWFSINLGDDLEVVGLIDLILGSESVDEETGEVFLELEVIDWKTSKLFTSATDAHESLQLSLYIMAAKTLWPEATKITAALHMLESSSHLQTHRSEQALLDDVLFIKAVTTKIDTDTTWEPQLNSDCVYCHLRSGCDAYKNALDGPLPTIVEDPDNLEALANEREKVALLAKISEKRKKEIDEILKTHLRGSGQPLDLNDHFFKLSQVPRKKYPAVKACTLISKRLGLSFDKVIDAVCDIGKKKLDALFKEYTGPGDKRMVQAALANIEQVNYSSRLYHKKAKPNKKGKKK